METKDYIVRGIAANGGIRCFAITSRNLVEEARRRHNTSPVITAALGETSFRWCYDGCHDEESK